MAGFSNTASNITEIDNNFNCGPGFSRKHTAAQHRTMDIAISIFELYHSWGKLITHHLVTTTSNKPCITCH